MGTSGNVAGNKIFSFDTGVRNPQRNLEFLKLLVSFDGQILNKENRYKYYKLLIREGVYKVSKMPDEIRLKYQLGETLLDEEIELLIRINPQKSGDANRGFIDIRGLKDQGFITLEGKKMQQKLIITPLGHELLKNEKIDIIYTKAMIGLHANNPTRPSMFNKSRPFLNTLFVLNEIEKETENIPEFKGKGLLFHEFGAFVLSMKGCDYLSAVKDIMEYRKLYGKEYNEKYIFEYLTNNNITKESFKNAEIEYPDEVFRKFQMTGLVAKSGYGNHRYIRIDEYNRDKFNMILEAYQNYKFETFKSVDDYVDFMTNIVIPWENEEFKKLILIKNKEKELNVVVDKSLNLDLQLAYLDNIHNSTLFKNKVDEIEINTILNELIILSKGNTKSHKYEGIPDPLRLEWMVALLVAKIYGYSLVKPNIIFNSDGEPISFAPGGRPDAEFNPTNMTCLLESTLIRSTAQMENNETTSVSDHLVSYKSDKDKYSLLIAPKINIRISDYFQYRTSRNLEIFKTNVLLPVTIEKFIKMVLDNVDSIKLQEEINKCTELLLNDYRTYTNEINSVVYNVN